MRKGERESEEVDFDAKLLTQQYVSFFPSLSIQKVFKTEQKTNVLWVCSVSFSLSLTHSLTHSLTSGFSVDIRKSHLLISLNLKFIFFSHLNSQEYLHGTERLYSCLEPYSIFLPLYVKGEMKNTWEELEWNPVL